jgi:hypothetical protein
MATGSFRSPVDLRQQPMEFTSIVDRRVSEAIPIALAGGLGVLLLARGLRPLLLRMAPTTFQDVKVVLDGRVLLFSSLLTMLTVVLFASAPAVQLSGAKGASSLKFGDQWHHQK